MQLSMERLNRKTPSSIQYNDNWIVRLSGKNKFYCFVGAASSREIK
jgi:hypothetical protein